MRRCAAEGSADPRSKPISTSTTVGNAGVTGRNAPPAAGGGGFRDNDDTGSGRRSHRAGDTRAASRRQRGMTGVPEHGFAHRERASEDNGRTAFVSRLSTRSGAH